LQFELCLTSSVQFGIGSLILPLRFCCSVKSPLCANWVSAVVRDLISEVGLLKAMPNNGKQVVSPLLVTPPGTMMKLKSPADP
jgi:hypothetical protein